MMPLDTGIYTHTHACGVRSWVVKSFFLHLIGGCYPKYTNWIRKELPCRSVSYPAMIQGVCEKVVGLTGKVV